MKSSVPAINEKELSHFIQLCDENGNLNTEAIGWSRVPLTDCNLSHHPFRKKRWNYWAITTPDFLFSITISNIDYLGMVFTYFLDFKTMRFIEKTISPLFGKGCRMPAGVAEDIVFKDKSLSAAFSTSGNDIQILVNSPNFGGSKLDANIKVHYPPSHETMSVVIPWSMQNFQYTSKHNCLPATGSVKLDSSTYQIGDDSSFACLDYGRGVWPYSCFWNWASFSGKSGAHIMGVNLGAGWTDGTGLTENSITCDGIITKLSEDILFKYDPKAFMKPWKIVSKETGRVRLTFTPFYERFAKTDVIVLTSAVHQMFGQFEGTLIPEGQKPIHVKNLVGWAEDHHARW